MSAACPIFGDFSYLTLADEAVFGVQDDAPNYFYHPVLSYAMEDQPEMRQPMPFTGFTEEFDNLVVHQHSAGQVTMPLYGWHYTPLTFSLAQKMMAWAFANLETVCALPSRTLQWAEGPDVENKTTLGTTVNGATLSGSDDNGASITLALDLMAASEVPLETAQVIPSTLSRINEFVFTDCSFKIGPNSGALVTVPMKSFQWQQQRNLTPVFNGAYNPQFFRPAKPTNTFQFAIEKADGTWDAIRRATDASNYYGRLFLKGLHNGTGTSMTSYATVTINFPRLSFRSVKDNYVRSGPLQQTVSFGIQKPSVAGASAVQTWVDA